MKRPVVAIHQPNYLPWLGWFAKAAQADVLVLLDDVQFSKQSYTNRVTVKTPSGTTRLTVPIKRHGNTLQRIDEVEIADDPRWKRRHLETLRQAYGRSPGWDRLSALLGPAFAAPESNLALFNERLIGLLLDAFGIDVDVQRASDLGDRVHTGSEGLVEICRATRGATYLSGRGGRSYNDPDGFAATGVDLRYSVFEHPTYAQPHGDFVPGLSALDLLFSDPSGAPEVLRSGIGAPTTH